MNTLTKPNNPNTIPEIPNYQIANTVYSGSRTVVYRGIRRDHKIPVAIKMMKRQYPTFSELVQFRNQYAIAKNLDIPGIIQAYTLESYQNGYALVMEDFGGIALQEFIQGNPLTLKQFLPIAIQLADILQHLNQNRVIHKDIKPANILIHPETKQVKLIDFSIASLLPKETQEIQNPNILEGTLAYISPEQTGRMNRAIDYRSDFYSLGVTFYELLTGELPFQSNDPMELVHSHIARMPSALGKRVEEIPGVLSDIVLKLLAKNAEDRYQSAFGLKYDLEKCRSQLQETGEIENFEIAKRDLCDRFSIPEKLYGRKEEVAELLAAFERVAGGATEMMLVAGFSGIGKTAVVSEVHKPIARQRGYFVKGKFDQFNRNIPFSAFVIAFRSLVEQLLTESDEQIQQWKNKILEAVGENGRVVIDVIPELETIIGKQPPAVELSGSAAQNRFNLLFQKFTQVFTSAEHPLVIFLDDLQWADSASLNLMQVLMADSNYLLLIGAYRDNEVNPAHPLMLTLSEIEKAGLTIDTVTLTPLSESQIARLVADTLKSTENLALPLSKLVFQKTKGNPFFATQFLKALHEENFIQFNSELGCWQCDMTKINQQALTEDVVEFMGLQLTKLPVSTQKILKLAACIGNQFDLAILAIVSQQSEIETAAALWKALQEGLILPKSEVYKFYVGQETPAVASEESQTITYQFLHDRVQQAAYSLIPEEEKQTTHYQIGQLLLHNIPPESREERIFELVGQLNYGTALISDRHEREELAGLNLTACRKARAATAYEGGRSYVRTGLLLLGEKAWEERYELTLAFHDLGAELAMLCGDFEEMEGAIATVIDRSHSVLETVSAYRIRIVSNITRNRLSEAIAIAREVLQKLDLTLPETATLDDVRQVIAEISTLMGEREVEDLLDLPIAIDAEKIATIEILKSIFAAAYISGASMLFALLVALGVKLSIEYGNTSVSASVYSSYGLLACSFLKDVDTGVKFGQLALEVTSKLDAKAVKPEVLHMAGIFTFHRKSHLKETLPLLKEGYTAGLEVGNLEFSGYNAQVFCMNSFWCGRPLATIEPEMRAYQQGLLQLNQLTQANWCRVYWQTTLNLLEGAERPHIMSGEALEEAEVLPQWLSASDFYALSVFYAHKLMLGCLFEEIEAARGYAVEVKRYFIGGMGTICEPAFYFYDSLSALAAASGGLAERSELLQLVAENQGQLQQQWATYAPTNHQHKVDLVEAEKCRVLGEKVEAIELYDKAIAGAKANEYIQEEAIANELAAKFHLDWGKEKVASGYMQEAYYCYARWGAKAKVADLERRHPQLLAPILQQTRSPFFVGETVTSFGTLTSTSSRTSSSSSISAALDLASILKANQTISSEIELDKLLSSLLSIVIENAGADKCVLMLSEGDRLFVRGSIAAGGEPAILERVSVEDSGEIPLKLIYKVARERQTLVLMDASAEPIFGGDSYIIRQQPKSILCGPILHQGKSIGILYLENKLVKGAFARDRVELLNVLCAQAAISLENARLYESSQEYAQKLERTLLDLQSAQVQLVQSEKMSALGNLVSGVGHEMNNPLGFIWATLQQTKPAVGDVFDHLKLYRETFSNKSSELVEHEEEIDLDYTLEDLPKMLDSMEMACDRLKHISTSLRTFSRSDRDYKVPFNLHDGIDSTLLILKHRLKANDKRPEIKVVKNYGSLPEVNCYPGQLNQVFMNLLANALDALEEWNKGETRITITTEIDEEKERAIVRIKDNGAGMSEEVKKKIFDHLFTTKEVGKGTGLGLSISRQIVVEKHGGTINCTSEVGEGTEFAIALPLS